MTIESLSKFPDFMHDTCADLLRQSSQREEEARVQG